MKFLSNIFTRRNPLYFLESHTLDGLKLLSQYFTGFSETGDNKAIEIVTKLKDKEYLLAFVVQENNIIEN